METWFSQATRLASLNVEICFLLSDNFFHGPDRWPAGFDHTRLREKLTLPDFPRREPSRVTTSEAIGHEDALVEYYRQIVRLARQHKKPFSSISQYFWLRLSFWNTEHELHVAIPWLDSFQEIDSLLGCLEADESGLVNHNQDQGWELEVYLHEARFYFRQRDPESAVVEFAVSVPCDALRAQIEPLRTRARQIIATLSRELGADVWTAPGYRATPAFLESAGTR